MKGFGRYEKKLNILALQSTQTFLMQGSGKVWCGPSWKGVSQYEYWENHIVMLKVGVKEDTVQGLTENKYSSY